MIYFVAGYFKQFFSIFKVVHYVSFRSMAAFLTSLLCSFIAGKSFIELSRHFFRSPYRKWAPKNHESKANMPSMGGVFILAVVMLNSFLWCNLSDFYVWIFLSCLIGFGCIGFLDDWKKIKENKGILAYQKFILQIIVAFIMVLLLFNAGLSININAPFLKWFNPSLGWFFMPWAVFIIVGCSNAVNLTDGLDGLATISLIANFATFTVICYLAGHYEIANYLHIAFAKSAEMVIIGSTLLGALIGFLWYNTYPAEIFMGDVGSLALGSGLALMAIICKQELLLPISGGIFVVETLSVIIQVFYFKFFGKKIFKMAPIHHHFELLGWQESKITIRFGIISLILCLVALMALKVR